MGRDLQEEVLGYASSKRVACLVMDNSCELLESPDSLLLDLRCAYG